MITAAKVLGFTLGLALRGAAFVGCVYVSLQIINWLGA
jgi:hypothetical protein